MSLAGTRLGRFRITRLIGKGGTGEVYAARDEDLDREVAVKVLSSVVDVEPHRRRFLREARLAARLNHPNIASIHEVGDSDGRRYIVMELLEGETLRALMNERRLTVDESLSIARDVARALARAHAGDVTHRDVKPENIFITTPAPGVMLAKVLDFGLAHDELTRKRADDEDTATDLTGPGEACGTAGYLAPEQARGATVDVRADVFSCGAVLYEMLTGKRAFDGRNQLARMLAVVKQEPEPLRSRLPDVRPEIEQLVERCLAKEPAARYADGSELLAALEQALRTSLRTSSPELAASDVAPRSDRSAPGSPVPSPELAASGSAPRSDRPAPASSPERAASASGSASPSFVRGPRVAADGSALPVRAVSTETPAPSTRSERAPALDATVPLQRRWPIFAAAGLVVVALALAVSSWRRSPWLDASEPASRSQTMLLAKDDRAGAGAAGTGVTAGDAPATASGGAPATASGGAPALAPERAGAAPLASAAPPSAPVGSAPASGVGAPAGARDVVSSGDAGRHAAGAPSPADRASARGDRRAPAHLAGGTVAAPPRVVPVAAASPVPEGPKTGTIRFPALDVMTVVVDGEHHRLRDRTLTLACGRHRVRAGLNLERTVDVPCGGSVLF